MTAEAIIKELMSKIPEEYLKAETSDPREIYQPHFQFDTHGRVYLPFALNHKILFHTKPGSKNVGASSEAPDGTPETDPGSLKTGTLYASTRISIGPSSDWQIVLSGGNFNYPLLYTNGTLSKFYLDKNGNVYIAGEIEATSGKIGGWTIASNELYAGSGTSRVGLKPGTYPFYAGSDDPSSAPFRVDVYGICHASDFYHTGGEVGGETVADVASGSVKANLGLDADGFVQKVIQGSKLSGSPADGLNMTNDHIGYYKSSTNDWMVYIKNDGRFMFKGNNDNYITWDGSTFVVKGHIYNTGGEINADYITAGELIGRTIKTSSSLYVNRVIIPAGGDAIEFWNLDNSLSATISVLYNPTNYLSGISLDGGGDTFLSLSGKSNMGFAQLGVDINSDNSASLAIIWDGGSYSSLRLSLSSTISGTLMDVPIDADLVPYASGKDLGSSSVKWQNLYLSGTVYANDLDITGDIIMDNDKKINTDMIDFRGRSSAPSSPTAGTLYYDWNINKLKVYNGSAWETVSSS